MIEIKNKNHSPVQVLVRSKNAPRAFTTLIIPGIGVGKNVVELEDEVVVEEILKRLVKSGLVSTRYISNKKVPKGE